ncbi:tRNA (adenosine(37)-N6)-threonylcarbamoyltransferase complex dimerization subunit type 1 TsaB [Gilvimarinus chinensis]|uniref:tRNA (adenosine(37)-N6)-threonylcarbamoyltransferase complex dimerization subunit type 1 TsaB n=1 Tax=Gilvimarinus chinensis TaxID=396005 RepID=UPI0003636782|nr:tRNA (adenosine(37)-N6)-threonylcarbamoyltransferase complex dimerization subunit type 1 TsaB [Gilvimarinus chinensis]
MSKLLALDTSGDACSVALWHDGHIIENFEMAAQSHTQRALPMIDELLSQTNTSLEDVDALAIGAGPGSFTGLRIGMGVVQGLAFASDKPVVPVGTLEALAWQALQANHNVRTALPALDARMGEVYWGVYQLGEDGKLQELCGPAANAPEMVTELLPTDCGAFVGIGGGWALPALQKCSAEFDAQALPRAAAVVELAARYWREGKLHDVMAVQPSYVRDTVSWKKRERIRSAPTQ